MAIEGNEENYEPSLVKPVKDELPTPLVKPVKDELPTPLVKPVKEADSLERNPDQAVKKVPGPESVDPYLSGVMARREASGSLEPIRNPRNTTAPDKLGS